MCIHTHTRGAVRKEAPDTKERQRQQTRGSLPSYRSTPPQAGPYAFPGALPRRGAAPSVQLGRRYMRLGCPRLAAAAAAAAAGASTCPSLIMTVTAPRLSAVTATAPLRYSAVIVYAAAAAARPVADGGWAEEWTETATAPLGYLASAVPSSRTTTATPPSAHPPPRPALPGPPASARRYRTTYPPPPVASPPS